MLTGYKTYITAAIAALIGVDQGLIAAGIHVPPVPGYVIMLLGAFGLYSVRSGITTDTAKAVSDIVAQVAPAPTPVAPRPDHPDDPAFHSGSKMAGK